MAKKIVDYIGYPAMLEQLAEGYGCACRAVTGYDRR